MKQKATSTSVKKDIALIFARKLASSDADVRRRAVRQLANFFEKKTKQLSEVQMLKIWKGLWYCMFLSDKPLVQQALAERLSNLIQHLKEPKEVFRFWKAFYNIMAREWAGIDYLRIDKFMMLVSQVLHDAFHYLESHNWDGELVAEYARLLLAGPLQTVETQHPIGLTLHVCDVFLRELLDVTNVPLDASSLLLAPFIEVASQTANYRVRDRICTDVIMGIIVDAPAGIAAKFKIDWNVIMAQLVTTAKAQSTPIEHRKSLYALKNWLKRLLQGEHYDESGEAIRPSFEASQEEAEIIVNKDTDMITKADRLAPQKRKHDADEDSDLEDDADEIADDAKSLPVKATPPKKAKLAKAKKQAINKTDDDEAPLLVPAAEPISASSNPKKKRTESKSVSKPAEEPLKSVAKTVEAVVEKPTPTPTSTSQVKSSNAQATNKGSKPKTSKAQTPDTTVNNVSTPSSVQSTKKSSSTPTTTAIGVSQGQKSKAIPQTTAIASTTKAVVAEKGPKTKSDTKKPSTVVTSTATETASKPAANGKIKGKTPTQSTSETEIADTPADNKSPKPILKRKSSVTSRVAKRSSDGGCVASTARVDATPTKATNSSKRRSISWGNDLTLDFEHKRPASAVGMSRGEITTSGLL